MQAVVMRFLLIVRIILVIDYNRLIVAALDWVVDGEGASVRDDGATATSVRDLYPTSLIHMQCYRMWPCDWKHVGSSNINSYQNTIYI